MHCYQRRDKKLPIVNNPQKSSNSKSTLQFVDKRNLGATPNSFQQMAGNGEKVAQMAQWQLMANQYVSKQSPPIQKKNKTGLPDSLKSGIEQLSGHAMDDVRVHYNSSKPAQLNAHAFAQGNQIHLGTGQEKHLPHEAWHVVQQKQTRVRPTMQMKGDTAINDHPALEREADEMGAKAIQRRHSGTQQPLTQTKRVLPSVFQLMKVSQRDIGKYFLIDAGILGFQTGELLSIRGGGWYKFAVGRSNITIQGSSKILRRSRGTVKRRRKKVRKPRKMGTFSAGGVRFNRPGGFKFTSKSAERATEPLKRGAWGKVTRRKRNSGVKVGHFGSYGGVQYAEKVGDKLTGDHQPSGAAIKEAIRVELHKSLNRVLTRSMARNAYKKAITVVMTDAWHKAVSRTYGGRNSKGQISADSKDLINASIKDWELTAPELLKVFSKEEVQDIWNGMNRLRVAFFKTGEPQYM